MLYIYIYIYTYIYAVFSTRQMTWSNITKISVEKTTIVATRNMFGGRKKQTAKKLEKKEKTKQKKYKQQNNNCGFLCLFNGVSFS